jgi:hypothetical protein
VFATRFPLIRNKTAAVQTHEALGGGGVSLMWIFISSIVVMVRAQSNGEIERQAVTNTTVLRNVTLRQRGAFAAGTVGPPAASRKAVTENEK